MKKTVLLLSMITIGVVASAQITSNFDTDADSWTFFLGTALAPNHSASGGNPTGFVSITYSSFVYNYFTAGTEVWKAPAKFLGNQLTRSMDMNLRFDLQASHTAAPSDVNGDIIIRSNLGIIAYTLPTKPAIAPAWSSYSIKLDETQGWRVNNTTGALATRNQIIAVLTNITAIEIRGTYATNATYTSGLDNVILEQKTLGIAPAVTSLSTASGKPGDVITITGSGFNTVSTNNVVSFGIGGVKAVVQSATAIQLTVVVPQNAPYGPIIITNTATGLSTRTAPFNPVFDGGGRIIPASFKPKFDIPTIGIESVSAADVDGDGWIDLAVTNDFTDRVIDIYRNLGTGGTLSPASFSTKVSIAYSGVSVNDSGLWFVDLDGDGKPDAVTSNSAGGVGLYVTFRNTSTPGSISFEAPEYWSGASDESPISFIGDLDGDGRPEMMSGEGAIPGGFWFNQNISTPGNIEFGSWFAPFGLSVINGFTEANAADLNGDGKPELIVTNGQGSVVDILQNTSTPGTPTFVEAFQIIVSHRSILIADMNLDGKNDLIYKSGVGFRIRLNTDTDGTLTAADFATEILVTGDLGGTGDISIGDVNGDGKPDIIDRDDFEVGVFENKFAGGTFDATAFVPAYQHEGTQTTAFTDPPLGADLNGDGKPEMIAGVRTTVVNKISIYENKNVHAPVIAVNTVSPLAAPVGATVTITGDFFSTTPAQNIVRFGAVRATVLTATKTQLTVSVPPGAAYAPVSVTKDGLTSTYRLPFKTTFSSGVTFNNTHFAPPVNYTLTAADYDIAVGDLNNDGKPDIVADAGTQSYAFRNEFTSGSISTSTLVPNDTLGPANFRDPTLRDFDADGYLDVMDGDADVKRNVSIGANINFAVPVSYSTDGLLSYGDFNADGKVDVVATNATIAMQILENRLVDNTFIITPLSSFSTAINFTRPSGNGGAVVAGDFDGDGFDDAITTNSNVDNISIFRNLGLGRISTAQFAPRVDIAVGDVPTRIYVGDFDADGKLDVLFQYGAGTNSTMLTIMHNTSTVGNISFTRIDLTNPGNPTLSTIADIDGDGKPEIITTSETGNRFSIFKNLHTTGALTAASFDAPFNTTVTAPRGIATGDLNLDGKPEIILTRAAGFLVVYENRVSAILPPSITSFTPTSGAAGSSVEITGTNFDITPSNNIVSFGVFAGTKGIIQSASTTQLTVQVPDGAVYGPLTITNKVTGLSARSNTPFNSVFEGGGRIIPASFKDRFSIATIPIEGWFVDDIDGDGWEDFAVANNNTEDQIDIYRNLGLGGELSAASFAAKVTLPMPPLGGSSANGTGLWFADLDGDGKTDAVSSTHSGSGSAFVTFRNTSTAGNITFEAAEYWAGGSDETPISLVTDFDGDGRPDLLAGEGSLSSVAFNYFWINQNLSIPGDIGFGSPIFPFNGSVVNAFAVATAGDLDGDGKNELVITHNFGQQTTVLKNTSTLGVPSFSNAFTLSTNQYNLSVHVADMNLDGKNDLVYKISGEVGIHIRLNANSGGALVAADFTNDVVISGDLGTGGGISLADVNGDGKTDIVASDNTDVGVYENIYAGGVFDDTAFVPAYQVLGGGSSTPRISDLNHDGKPDFVIASGGAISIVENKNVSAPVISINTVSPLSAPVGATVTITGNNFSTLLTDNDVWFGAVKATVLTASENLLTVAVPAGAAYAPVSVTKSGLTSRYHLPFQTTFGFGVTFDNTHFAPPVSYTLTGAGYNIEAGDLNIDGRVDILASAGNTAYAFRNDFTTGAIATTTLAANDTLSPTTDLFGNPRLEDFDGDGYLDVASTNTRIRKNITTGSNINFTANINYTGQGNLAYADFNQDGKMDIAVSNSGGAQLNLIENRTIPGNFTTTGTYGSFSSVFAFAKPGTGGEVVAADFDVDGFPDVITVNLTTDNISIFRNIGGKRITVGQFAARVDIAVGDMPNRINKGDFDSDGKLDLMLYHAAGTTSTLLILLHNTSTTGNISFNRIDLTNPSATTVAHVADLDGDGKPEIITTSEAGNRFSIFKNIHTSGALTAASFAAPFNTTVTAPRGITTGDLNLDGKPEIIITRAAGLLVVYENLISSFSPPTITSFTPASGPIGTTVTITGTNFDGIAANNIAYFGATRANVTSATSTQLTVVVPMGATHQSISVQTNGLTAHSLKPFVVTFAGGGSFDNCSFESKVNFETNDGLSSEAFFGDIDGDGKVDVITTKRNVNSISIYRNTSISGQINSSSFAPKIDIITGTNGSANPGPVAISFGDIDGDGKPDIAVTNYRGGTLAVFRNLSTSGIISLSSRVDFAIGDFATGASLRDIDGDGKLDAVVTSFSDGVSVLRNTAAFGIINVSSFASRLNFATGPNPFHPSVEDFDSDGRLDIAVPNADNYTVSLLRNTSTSGTVSFAPQQVVTYAGGTPVIGTGTYPLSAGDLDGDGKIDLVVTNNTLSIAPIFRNTSIPGTITFAPQVDLTTSAPPAFASISDLDGDGKVDLAIFNGLNNPILIYKNSNVPGTISTSSFGSPIGFGADPLVGIFGSADIDGDGKNDIVNQSKGFYVLRNVIGEIAPPTITSFTPSSGPVGTTVTITGINFSTPFNNTVEFNGVPATITASTATSLTVTVPAGATTGPIQITIGCSTATSSNFTVGFLPIGITTQPSDFITCIGGIATFTTAATGTTNITYQWQFSTTLTGAYNDIANGAGYSNVTTASISVNTSGNFGAGFYRCKIDGDLALTAFSNAAELTVNIVPIIPTIGTTDLGCAPISTTLNPTGASAGEEYKFYDAATGGNLLNSGLSFTTPSLTVSTTYHISTYNTTTLCESARVPAVVNVQSCNPPVVETSIATAFLEGIVTIDLEPLISDADDNLDPSTLQIITQPASGAPASLSDFILTIDYTGVPFPGTDSVEIEICDLTLICTQQNLMIELDGAIEVFNAISPNNDSQNDFFFIQYIELFPDTEKNKVTIYNRWGDIVWEGSDYNNSSVVFEGTSTNGKELPSGTYFYKIEFTSGRELKTGYLSLKR